MHYVTMNELHKANAHTYQFNISRLFYTKTLITVLKLLNYKCQIFMWDAMYIIEICGQMISNIDKKGCNFDICQTILQVCSLCIQFVGCQFMWENAHPLPLYLCRCLQEIYFHYLTPTQIHHFYFGVHYTLPAVAACFTQLFVYGMLLLTIEI